MRFKPLTLLWIAALLQIVWGLVPSASALVISEIPVELYIAIRWTISGFIFFLYLLTQKKLRKFSLADFSKVAVLGILGYGLASLGTLYGLKLGGVTNFALISAFNPVITGLTSLFILKEKPSRWFFLALPLCVTGLILLVKGRSEISTSTLAWTTFGILASAAFLEAITFTFSKRLKNSFGMIEYLAIAQLSAAGLMWLLQFTVFHQVGMLTHLSSKGIAAAFFVSIVACVLCYAVLYWLLNHVDGHRLALFDGVHTLSATFFGWILFHETINHFMIAGGILLIMGLVVGNGIKDSSKESESLREAQH